MSLILVVIGTLGALFSFLFFVGGTDIHLGFGAVLFMTSWIVIGLGLVIDAINKLKREKAKQ